MDSPPTHHALLCNELYHQTNQACEDLRVWRHLSLKPVSLPTVIEARGVDTEVRRECSDTRLLMGMVMSLSPLHDVGLVVEASHSGLQRTPHPMYGVAFRTSRVLAGSGSGPSEAEDGPVTSRPATTHTTLDRTRSTMWEFKVTPRGDLSGNQQPTCKSNVGRCLRRCSQYYHTSSFRVPNAG